MGYKGRSGQLKGPAFHLPSYHSISYDVIPSVAEESRRLPLTHLEMSRFLGYARNDMECRGMMVGVGRAVAVGLMLCYYLAGRAGNLTAKDGQGDGAGCGGAGFVKYSFYEVAAVVRERSRV